jgi:lon-related putative ATP-dependent protease
MADKIKELSIDQLRHRCDPKKLAFSSTESLPALEGIIGQKRALGALSFGVDIKSHGYHIYALGPVGTGKATIIRKFLKKDAKDKPIPNDWLYINNFDDRDKPHTLELPAGKGRELRDDMDQMVDELKTEVPKAFESKEYTEEQAIVEQEFQRKSKGLFQELDQTATKRGFKLIQTPQGMAAIPVDKDKKLTPEQIQKLDKKKQAEIDVNQEKLMEEIREALRKIEELQKEGKNRIIELDQRVIGFSVNHLINDLKKKYAEHKNIMDFLSDSQKHLLKSVQAFKQIKQNEREGGQPRMPMSMGAGPQEPSFDEYRVNLIIDNSKTVGAPVIIEKNPTAPNLIGRIEQQGWFGTLVTNFRMIKGGSLHKAMGGYLIVEVLDLLQKPFAWPILKRALKNREVVIESMAEAFGALVTRTLEPESIPLDIKVILIGDPYLYYMLYSLDQEFKELFKVKADFAEMMDWEPAAAKQYAQFIGAICREEELKHFAPSGVAKVVEHGARLADHRNKLATKFGDIVDLVRQSSFWANTNGNKLVQAEDVQKALDEKTYRSSRIEERVQEMIADGTILIDTEGMVLGQINGISVMQLGDYSFGRPSRITARTYAGGGGVVNIDREVKLGGPIHNKGAMILTGYFGGTYATEVPMTFSASITFEQIYGEVEGDSASSTEIYSLLSSLSEYPIRQDIAVTGSVNQMGEVQPIGGVNEKIEGFFQICKIKGFTGKQGVMIPTKNLNHLMLHENVVEAVKKGKFHVYAVATIDEGIELLTGIPAGKLKADGTYPKNTVNWAVQQRIIDFSNKAKEFVGGKKETKKTKKKKKKA